MARARLGRLKRRAEFLRIAAQGRKFSTPGLVLQALQASLFGELRLGFTCSRKVGNAVARNRARRRLRAAAAEVMPEAAAMDYDYVLIGGSKYLLPTHSESLSCARDAKSCTRNVIEFRNYKKFSADASITFDDDK